MLSKLRSHFWPTYFSGKECTSKRSLFVLYVLWHSGHSQVREEGKERDGEREREREGTRWREHREREGERGRTKQREEENKRKRRGKGCHIP